MYVTTTTTTTTTRKSRQVIIDVALTGVDGQSRTSDKAVERPLQVRYDQKMAKYGQVAAQKGNITIHSRSVTGGSTASQFLRTVIYFNWK